MELLELTLPTPAENLALDEALLEEAESAETPRETLRIWESPSVAVVLGRSSRAADEARRDECQRLGAPVLRRASGGAAVVIGPGCLMYSVVLSYVRRPELAMLDEVHRFVLGRVAEGVRRAGPAVELKGISDLVLEDRKFSGNSLRCKRGHVLYHGTLLYAFPLELLEQLLGVPPRQPDYRQGRRHGQFVTNLPTTAAALRAGLIEAWGVRRDDGSPLRANVTRMVEQFVAERYSQASWNERL